MTSLGTIEKGGTAYELIPEGTNLEAIVSMVERRTSKKTNEDGSPKYYVSWSFDLTDPQYEYEKDDQIYKKRIYGISPAFFSTSENSILRSWAGEILGIDEFPEDFELTTEMLEGRDCIISIEINEYEKDGKTIKKNQVRDVYRSTNAGTSAPPSSLEEDPF